MIYELPITNDPSQEFICELDGKNYLFRLQLNVRSDSWTLDISTGEDDPIVQGLSLSLGADLLVNERFLRGSLFIVDYKNTDLDPSGDNLKDYGLVWSDE